MKALMFLTTLTAMAAGQTWVPYTAHYTISNTLRDGNGTVLSQTTQHINEIREIDGSTATFVQVNGRNESGQIWFTCGDMVRLNYS